VDSEIRTIYDLMFNWEVIEVIQEEDPLLPDCVELIIVFKDKYGARRHFLTTLCPCPGQS